MREIIFKAKRIDNGEWVEGLLWKKKYNSNKIFISCFPNKDDNEEVYVVDSTTICQYTGLTDKNGCKIWENDIVEWIGRLHKVTFYESICSYVLVSSTGHWVHMEMNYGNKLECYDYEVIGNIFDNPELLKGGVE